MERQTRHTRHRFELDLHVASSVSQCVTLTLKFREKCRSFVRYFLVFYFIWLLSSLTRDSDWIPAGRSRRPISRPGRGKIYFLSTSFRPVLGPTQPLTQWVPGVKLLGREADHSLPTRAKAKNTWIFISTTPCTFIA
jgi:hypothetical protein